MAGKRKNLPLFIGAAAGIALAAHGLLVGEPPAELPAEAVAMVNERPVLRADFERALRAVAADRRTAELDAGLRHHVLDRLIDEELLVQRGLELGLAEQDPLVRANLSGAVIGLITARAEDSAGREPTDEELAAFLREHSAYFSGAPRLWIEQRFYAVADSSADAAALDRARRARELWSRGAELPVELRGDRLGVELPAGGLTFAKLRDYLGPTVTRGVVGLAAGELSPPLRSGLGYHLIEVVERRAGRVAELAEAREQVRAEWLRSAGERQLRRFLADRRAASRLQIDEDLL